MPARRKVVDARYLEAAVPSTRTPSFSVSPAARMVPVNGLVDHATASHPVTILGGGKTAVDACVWLLEQDVDPDRIRWVRPREAWFHNRAHFQPLAQVGRAFEAISHDVEAAAQTDDLDEVFDQLEDVGRVVRIDTTTRPTMFRGTMLNAYELDLVRQVRDVVRLGHVQRIEGDRIVLDRGDVPTSPGVVHVDCSAIGITSAPSVPVFGPDRIVLQQVRYLSRRSTPPSSHSSRHIGTTPRSRTGSAHRAPTRAAPPTGVR